ncbi:MAG: dUTP diphosphatase [Aeromonadaceae bacterium]
MTALHIKRLVPQAQLPARATELAAGLDVRACLHTKWVKVWREAERFCGLDTVEHNEPVLRGTVTLYPGDRALIPTGLTMRPAPGYCLKFYPRSGISLKQGLTLINCVGVGDEDYEQEYFVTLVNHSGAVQSIADGMRLCQLMVERVEPVEIIERDELPPVQSDRLGGFGSTGRG